MPQRASDYISALGKVLAVNILVSPRLDGHLAYLVEDGALVEAGQVVASMDGGPFELELTRAQIQFAQDQTQLSRLQTVGAEPKSAGVAQLEEAVQTDRASVDQKRRQLAYTSILSPVRGIARRGAITTGD
jgi:multidrug resistance efflux pump